ncbi:hydrolase [Clostridia bacterium]|nr:hydrolase [Clostridia bacterium]
MRKTTYCLPANGIELYCSVLGAGETVVLLHGHGQSQRVFKSWERELSKSYRVILIDSRNHGQSGKAEKISISLMAQDVYAALKTLYVKRANIIGYSDGANIALQLAIDHPQIVKNLVIISGNATPAGLKDRFFSIVQIWRSAAKRLYKLKLLSVFSYNMTRLIAKEPNISDEQLKRIEAPTLLVYGDQDLIEGEHIDYLNHQIPNSKVKILEKTNHFMMLKKFKDYEPDILAHFGK